MRKSTPFVVTTVVLLVRSNNPCSMAVFSKSSRVSVGISL
jgi:hypothetical protein